MDSDYKRFFIGLLVVTVVISSIVGGIMGFWAGNLSTNQPGILGWFNSRIFGENESVQTGATRTKSEKVIEKVNEGSAVISAVEKVNPAVVSIIVTKDLPIIERYYSDPFGSDFFRRFFSDEDIQDFFGFGVPQYRQQGTEKREIGGGTGFLLSPDGYIVTNQHVVADEEAEYTVLMNDETKHDATVLGRDTVNDLAIIKIEGNGYPFVDLGDSSNLKVGQTVIAIGNALGEFRNTVSTGVVSGLARSVTAAGAGIGSEQLTGVIQTDASINPGNSGGPLLNLAGQVIGINTAMAVGAENIGFAIPITEVRNIYENVRENGRIVRPWLGVRYVQINEIIAEDNNLDVDYGALIVRGEQRTDLAVIPGSPADKAGLEENDIILEIDGNKIDDNNLLAREIIRHKPGDDVTLKILHDGEEKEIRVTLEEME
jgi:serine protease Do